MTIVKLLRTSLVIGFFVMALAASSQGRATLREKMEKIEAAGKKIAVVHFSGKVSAKKHPFSGSACQDPPKTTTDLIGSYEDITSVVVDEFKKGFNIDGIEQVDIEAMFPYEALPKIKDWQSDGYSMIILTRAEGVYEQAMESYPSSRFFVSIDLLIFVVVEGKEALKVIDNKTVGDASTSYVDHPECFTKIKDYVANIGAPDILVGESIDLLKEKLPEIIAKENKKYDKSMKKKKR